MALSALGQVQIDPSDPNAQNILPIEEYLNRRAISGEKNGIYFKF